METLPAPILVEQIGAGDIIVFISEGGHRRVLILILRFGLNRS